VSALRNLCEQRWLTSPHTACRNCARAKSVDPFEMVQVEKQHLRNSGHGASPIAVVLAQADH